MSPDVRRQESDRERERERYSPWQPHARVDSPGTPRRKSEEGGGGADDTFLSASRQDDGIQRRNDDGGGSALKTLDPETTNTGLPRYATPSVRHRQQNWSNL